MYMYIHIYLMKAPEIYILDNPLLCNSFLLHPMHCSVSETDLMKFVRSEGCLCLPKEQYSGVRFEHALQRLLEGKFRYVLSDIGKFHTSAAIFLK